LSAALRLRYGTAFAFRDMVAAEERAVVTVIGEVAGALVCESGGRRILVPRALILAASEVHEPGDHGHIVVPTESLFDLGLADDVAPAEPVSAPKT
jgi:hypothetical protein